MGIPIGAPCVLLIGSDWTSAPMAQAAAALTDARVHVLAVAGTNKRLEQELRVTARIESYSFHFFRGKVGIKDGGQHDEHGPAL